MERLHMNYLRDLIHRVRSGESDRRIARDVGISRTTVRKYREWADAQGYVQPDTPLPDNATLAAALGAKSIQKTGVLARFSYCNIVPIQILISFNLDA